eukprot:84055-Hanusia_phi.AAC.1
MSAHDCGSICHGREQRSPAPPAWKTHLQLSSQLSCEVAQGCAAMLHGELMVAAAGPATRCALALYRSFFVHLVPPLSSLPSILLPPFYSPPSPLFSSLSY